MPEFHIPVQIELTAQEIETIIAVFEYAQEFDQMDPAELVLLEKLKAALGRK